MAYRYEKEEGNIKALVIDGWEKGIADSPYLGIASMKNVNASWLPGATYVNYKRQAATISGGTMATPMYYASATGTSTGFNFILDSSAQVWKIQNGNSTATLITGNTTGANVGKGIVYWQNYLFVFGSSGGTDFVDVCGDGTGVGGITSSNWVSVNSSGHFLVSLASVSITGATTAGQSSLTLSSSWQYVSGNYEVNIGSGTQYVIGTFTNGSTAVTLSPVLNQNNASTTIGVNIFPKVAKPGSPYQHMALVGYDDVVYFCNGVTVGSILAPTGNFFTPTNFKTSKFNYNAVQLPLTEIATWLACLSDSLMIAGLFAIYPWGAFRSTQPTRYDIPQPINENTTKIINILNTIYIFAGSKGNIYQTNGYQITLFKKIPDSFLGVIDPNWVIGGIMFHRNKLYFGAAGVSGSTKLVGVFSLALVGGSTQYSFETAGAINCESQNSFGFTPTSSFDATNVLIDGNAASTTTSATSSDNYISAWLNNSVGGVDFNDTTLWDNYQPIVESDLIPVGTYLQSKTFENVEYKLDRPLQDGDSIRLSYRTSFTDSYTTIGTTTASSPSFLPLSDNFNSNINNAQWLQLRAEFKCASVSSFIPLREIRIH